MSVRRTQWLKGTAWLLINLATSKLPWNPQNRRLYPPATEFRRSRLTCRYRRRSPFLLVNWKAVLYAYWWTGWRFCILIGQLNAVFSSNQSTEDSHFFIMVNGSILLYSLELSLSPKAVFRIRIRFILDCLIRPYKKPVKNLRKISNYKNLIFSI